MDRVHGLWPAGKPLVQRVGAIVRTMARLIVPVLLLLASFGAIYPYSIRLRPM